MPTALEVVTEAREWIGTPYIHQQRKKGAATDCVGLIIGLYEHFVQPVPKKVIPSYSPWWAEEGNRNIMVGLLENYLVERDVTDRSPGVFLTFSLNEGKPIKHAGVMGFDNKLIHAYDRHPVHEVHLSDWWDRRVRRVFALPNMEG